MSRLTDTLGTCTTRSGKRGGGPTRPPGRRLNRKGTTMPERSTSRGLSVYAELTDASGSEIRVQQSSLATDDAVWIFANHPDGHEIPTRFRDRLAAAGFTRPVDLAELAAMLEPSPQLNVGQAKQVRDALDEFIREHEAAEDPHA